jgi:hypothetical protein
MEKPILFISRQIKESERKYGASQMECLALVWALDKLDYYTIATQNRKNPASRGGNFPVARSARGQRR